MKMYAFASIVLATMTGLVACGEQKDQKRTGKQSAEVQTTSGASSAASPSADDSFIPLPEETLALITIHEDVLQAELQRVLTITESTYTSSYTNAVHNPNDPAATGGQGSGGATAGHSVDAQAGVSVGGSSVKVGVQHDAGVTVAPGEKSVSSHTTFSIEIEIGKVFRKYHDRYPGVIRDQDSRKLQLHLCGFLEASIQKDTRLATQHWNQFLRTIADIEAQKRSVLKSLFGFVPKVVQATANLLRVATELVGAAIAFKVDSFNTLLDGLAESLFILVR